MESSERLGFSLAAAVWTSSDVGNARRDLHIAVSVASLVTPTMRRVSPLRVRLSILPAQIVSLLGA